MAAVSAPAPSGPARSGSTRSGRAEVIVRLAGHQPSIASALTPRTVPATACHAKHRKRSQRPKAAARGQPAPRRRCMKVTFITSKRNECPIHTRSPARTRHRRVAKVAAVTDGAFATGSVRPVPRLLLNGGSDERSAALAGDDQAALAQYLHRVPDSLVGDAVLLSQRALGRQLVLDLAYFDPGRDLVSDLDVGEVGTQRVYHRHVDERRRSASCLNLG